MNKIPNPENSNKRGWSSWSILRKIQIATVLVSVLLTIGIISLCLIIPSSGAGFGPLDGLAILVQLPTVIFLKVVCPDCLDKLRQQSNHVWFVLWLFVAAFINSFLLFIMATIGGWFIKKTKNKIMIL